MIAGLRVRSRARLEGRVRVKVRVSVTTRGGWTLVKERTLSKARLRECKRWGRNAGQGSHWQG